MTKKVSGRKYRKLLPKMYMLIASWGLRSSDESGDKID